VNLPTTISRTWGVFEASLLKRRSSLEEAIYKGHVEIYRDDSRQLKDQKKDVSVSYWSTLDLSF
jgi:ribosomal 50S subunit-recycling heat shock protein